MYESEPLVDGAGELSTGADRSACSTLSWRQPEPVACQLLGRIRGEPLHRRVCDYIAGMTDGFLVRTCDQLKLV